MNNKISICVPAYKRVHYLKRLLDSISSQTYKNYEVIITDDSDDNSVSELMGQYSVTLPIVYHKNSPALGTPRNWMAGIALASGDWIKIIHDDDWLSTDDALNQFTSAANEKTKFIFCGYNAFYEETGKYVNKTITQTEFSKLADNPFLLFAENKLGPPSVLMFHNSIKEYYDPNLKWFVDIEYYMRVLDADSSVYIDKALINMSYNDTQVTNYCFRNPDVEIPEAFYLLKRQRGALLKNIMVYDAWWRFIRNLEIRDEKKIVQHDSTAEIPPFIKSIIGIQKRIPVAILQKGVFSKIFMAVSYLFNYSKLAV
jgi:glycosyltransferase involved in cell wall biosynthesis